MSDLKPCPFCGGPAEISYMAATYGEPMQASKDAALVRCADLTCVMQGSYQPPERAIAAWNRRAPALGGSPSGGTVTLNNDPITVPVGDPVGYRRAPAKEDG